LCTGAWGAACTAATARPVGAERVAAARRAEGRSLRGRRQELAGCSKRACCRHVPAASMGKDASYWSYGSRSAMALLATSICVTYALRGQKLAGLGRCRAVGRVLSRAHQRTRRSRAPPAARG